MIYRDDSREMRCPSCATVYSITGIQEAFGMTGCPCCHDTTPEQRSAARQALELSIPLRPNRCVCGDEHHDVVAHLDRFTMEIRTLRCCSCGTLRSDRFIPGHDAARFYSDLYPVMHPGLNIDREAREQRQADWLLRLTDRLCLFRGKPTKHRPFRILEIGGRACQSIVDAQVVSWDVTDDTRLPRPDAIDPFDLVVSFHVLEHRSHPDHALRSWAKYLLPGGRIVAVVPDLLQVHTHRLVRRCGISAWWQLAHVWNWTKANVSLPFIKAGLDVRDVMVVQPGELATVGSLAVVATGCHDRVERYIWGFSRG